MNSEPVWALGLMSGTSLDGVDAALLRTDGESQVQAGAFLTLPYDDAFRAGLRAAMAGQGDSMQAEQALTLRHAEATHALLKQAELRKEDVRVIGFHGQTLQHRPAEGITWQIGNGALLAERTGIDVICDFRRADVAAGGQGAPLVPLYHAALAEALPKPVAILNIGGVANVTYCGDPLIAFDTGPGNALIDDAVFRATGASHDQDGAMALAGTPDEAVIKTWLRDPYFAAKPPKSLDRNHFAHILRHCEQSEAIQDTSLDCRVGLWPPRNDELANWIATLTRFTAACVSAGLWHLPQAPRAWYVCGGGRHNQALMHDLQALLGEVRPVEALGWNGDALEAQAFAYLAIRSLKGLPLSLPTTTGVSRAAAGGAFYPAACGAWRRTLPAGR